MIYYIYRKKRELPLKGVKMALTNTITQEQVKDFYIEVLEQSVSAYNNTKFLCQQFPAKQESYIKAQLLDAVIDAIREDLIIVDSGCGNIYATDEATIAAFELDLYEAYSHMLYEALYACNEENRNVYKIRAEAYKTVVKAFNKIFDK